MNATDHLGGVSSEAATPTHSASRKKRGMLPPLTPGDFNRVGKLRSNLSIALAGLWANRLRSLLTTLGIFIGVAAVVAALILTQGVEALILSLLGGLIGMLIGFLIGFGITSLTKLPFVITQTSLLMPFAISASIGVIFGLYPAVRAARLDPIEALRSL